MRDLCDMVGDKAVADEIMALFNEYEAAGTDGPCFIIAFICNDATGRRGAICEGFRQAGDDPASIRVRKG